MKFEFSNTESKDKRDSKGRFAEGNKSALTQNDIICLFPKCRRKSSSRGLCNRHYSMALRCVKNKETTWKRLEREGKATKAKLPFDLESRTLQKEWFITKDCDYFKPEKGDVRHVDDINSTGPLNELNEELVNLCDALDDLNNLFKANSIRLRTGVKLETHEE